MQSIIFTFINQDWNECVSIGSMEYYKTAQKYSKQIVNTLLWNHNKNDWDIISNLNQNALYSALVNTIKKKPTSCFIS